MRYCTDEPLRRAGYDEKARAQLLALRVAVEDVLRGAGDREAAADLLAEAATEPWFPMAYLPPELPPPDQAWNDMDHDLEPTLSQVTCQTLLMRSLMGVSGLPAQWLLDGTLLRQRRTRGRPGQLSVVRARVRRT